MLWQRSGVPEKPYGTAARLEFAVGGFFRDFALKANVGLGPIMSMSKAKGAMPHAELNEIDVRRDEIAKHAVWLVTGQQKSTKPTSISKPALVLLDQSRRKPYPTKDGQVRNDRTVCA